MNLHRVIENDWAKVAPADRTTWQNIASATNGWGTPGNAISIVGLVLVLTGLLILALDGDTLTGICLILIGRLTDILDGLVADWTGTKGVIGEGVDATVDKISLGICAIVMFILSLLPAYVAGIAIVHTLYNTALYYKARTLGVSIHSSYSGKIGTALAWATITCYVGRDLSGGTWHAMFSIVAQVTFIAFVVLAGFSSWHYTRTLFDRRLDSKPNQNIPR